MVPTTADSKMSVEITTETSYQGQGTCGCWCKADFKAVMRRRSQYLEMLCSVWGWRTETFDWQWLGEALGSLTGWGEPRAGMQEMDVDSKSGECRSLNGCKKLWTKVDSLAPRITHFCWASQSWQSGPHGLPWNNMSAYSHGYLASSFSAPPMMLLLAVCLGGNQACSELNHADACSLSACSTTVKLVELKHCSQYWLFFCVQMSRVVWITSCSEIV